MKQMIKEKIIHQIIDEGIALIDTKYGKDSPHYLAYHNTEHARDVMDAAVRIGEIAYINGVISKDDIALLELAACYHDAEHGKHGSENELESIAILAGKMQKTDAFTEEDIEKVTAMIKATIVQSVKGSIVQSATENYLTKILADADLCSFGKPLEIFWDRSKKLLFENTKTVFDSLGMQEKASYINRQIDVLQTHTYYTQEAFKLYPNKQENITKLRSILTQYG